MSSDFFLTTKGCDEQYTATFYNFYNLKAWRDLLLNLRLEPSNFSSCLIALVKELEGDETQQVQFSFHRMCAGVSVR